MVISIILSILFLVLAPFFLLGKGDMLIAGYNTAPEEERQKVNLPRLRLLMAAMMVITAIYCGILPFISGNVLWISIVTGAFTVVAILFAILANTWAKKK